MTIFSFKNLIFFVFECKITNICFLLWETKVIDLFYVEIYFSVGKISGKVDKSQNKIHILLASYYTGF